MKREWKENRGRGKGKWSGNGRRTEGEGKVNEEGMEGEMIEREGKEKLRRRERVKVGEK